ncbi:MAG: sulfite exporter TauE/SafE family protein [Candidatus Micrarchaeota archaeon]
MAFDVLVAAVLLTISAFAGFIGALAGIGGGVILVPFLVLFLNIPIHYAIGASIVGVVATSSVSASAYLRRRLVNLRLGIFLEAGTALGALAGASVAVFLPINILEMLFSLMAFYVCGLLLFTKLKENKGRSKQHALSDRLFLHSNSSSTRKGYTVHSPKKGFIGSIFAGIFSGLFGIGGGVIKVPLMNIAMRVPLREAAATSNFMVGITAATGAAVYLSRGYVLAEIGAPVLLGATLGSVLGSAVSPKVDVARIRIIFVLVLFYTALRMMLRSMGVEIGI